MAGRKFKFHGGEKGAALAVRVKTGARKSAFKKVLRDGTVVITLKGGSRDPNSDLIKYLAQELAVEEKKFQVIAGRDGKKKLISILDLDPAEIQEEILNKIG